MEMKFDRYGRRVVEESVLLAEFRNRLNTNPIHQQIIRKAQQRDTPADDLLDSLSLSPPNVMVE